MTSQLPSINGTLYIRAHTYISPSRSRCWCSGVSGVSSFLSREKWRYKTHHSLFSRKSYRWCFLAQKDFQEPKKYGGPKKRRGKHGVFGREVLQRNSFFLPNESLVLVGWKVARKRPSLFFIKDANETWCVVVFCPDLWSSSGTWNT